MLSYREVYRSLRRLDLDRQVPLLVHAAPEFPGNIQGGVDSLLGALLTCFQTVLAPAFTYRTMLVPEVGPANNAIHYGSDLDRNLEAEFFHPGMPVDKNLGELPEKLRRLRNAGRSLHPILSFSGVNAADFLEAQSLEQPFGVVAALALAGGWVLLLGADQRANASLHWAEALAGRQQFTRWSLTTAGVVECPGFPGCAQGFNELQPRLEALGRRGRIGESESAAYPLNDLIETARARIAIEPDALLCRGTDCEFCAEVRAANRLSVSCDAPLQGLGGEWIIENTQEG